MHGKKRWVVGFDRKGWFRKFSSGCVKSGRVDAFADTVSTRIGSNVQPQIVRRGDGCHGDDNCKQPNNIGHAVGPGELNVIMK